MSDQAEPLNLTPGQLRELRKLASNPHLGKNLIMRARIVLGAADGFSNSQLAKMLHTTRPTVIRTRKQFDERGVDGLVWTAENITPERIRAITDATQRSAPAAGGRWSTRSLARAEGVSHSTIHRVWQRFGLSGLMDFSVTNVRDVVGLYVNFPDAAMAFRVSEGAKPAIPDEGQRRRPGTVSGEELLRYVILAGLDALTEKTEVGSCWPHARLSGVVHFLDFLDRRIAKRWEVHVILEILETPDLQPLSAVNDWFAAHARFHAHYPPTKKHWIDEVRRWMAQASRETAPRWTRGLAELSGALGDYLRAEIPGVPLAWILSIGSRFVRRGSGDDISLGYILSALSNLEDALRRL
jgi:transposase